MTMLITRKQMQQKLKGYQIGYALAKYNHEHTKDPVQKGKFGREMHECEELIKAHKRILASNLLN